MPITPDSRAGAVECEQSAAVPIGPIVSSGHLATGDIPALSEFEFGAIMTIHAFNRWMVRGMAAVGVPDLSPLDVLVLHHINHRDKPKRLADICLVLNIEDTHLVSYSLKKLEKTGLVRSDKLGSEKVVSITLPGAEACIRYRDVREKLLVQAVKSLGLSDTGLSDIAALMRSLSGQYDQAARAAASL